jgi:hypothetical protein
LYNKGICSWVSSEGQKERVYTAAAVGLIARVQGRSGAEVVDDRADKSILTPTAGKCGSCINTCSERESMGLKTPLIFHIFLVIYKSKACIYDDFANNPSLSIVKKKV